MDRRITAINAQKRNPNRVNIHLDGEYAFSLAKIVAAWLYVDQTLTEEKTEDLLKKDSLEVANQKALKFLSVRPHSEKELRVKLIKHGFSETIINDVIERSRTAGYLGDEQFARTWIENRNTFRPRSRRMVAMELRQKGVDSQLIEEALSNSIQDDVLAFRLAERYARRLNGDDPIDFRRRLTGYLGRKGFTYDTIQDVMQKFRTEEYKSQLEKYEE